MRDRLNCPNCGAPLESDICQYCKTTFYDFASLEDGVPCYMRVKCGGMNITLKAIPSVQAMVHTIEYESAYDHFDRELMRFARSGGLDISVKFSAVQDGGALCKVTI